MNVIIGLRKYFIKSRFFTLLYPGYRLYFRQRDEKLNNLEKRKWQN